MPEYHIHIGDCLETLRGMLDKSVHCCVTSPPYFGLRDYGLPPTDWPEIEFSPMAGLPPITIPAMSCCLGLEPEPWAFVGHMVAVFRQVRRILADDGTLWLNLGDSYAANGKSGLNTGWAERTKEYAGGGHRAEPSRNRAKKNVPDSLKPKDLIGIPWRVAYALQADGWYLRQDIIWAKPNPMPESVRDRCTKAHEYVFLLSKSPRYYFDSEAIKEQAVYSGPNNGVGFGHGMDKIERSRDRVLARDTFKRDGSKREAVMLGQNFGTHRPDRADTVADGKRNRRSVWTVATKPYKGAHFATFPPALIEPCILAGCPVGGTVLDIFGGSGTTAGVALANDRNAELCELNQEYAELVPGRIASILAAYDKPAKKPRIKMVANDNAPVQEVLFDGTHG